MEIKKMPQADLRKQRAMYLSLGLMLSFAFALTAFEWKSYGEKVITVGSLEGESEDVILPPITSFERKRPKPPVVPEEIKEVRDDEKVETIQFKLDFTDYVAIDEPDLVAPPDEPTETIHLVVEEMPSPVGGLNAFNQYLSKNIKYPRLAQRMGIEGKVFVNFVIAMDGSLSDIQLLKGIGGGCDEEALRVIKAAPKWNPGKQRGVPVRVRMSLPITFTFNKR